MGAIALENIDKGFEDTKKLLFPVNIAVWLKIAFISIFAINFRGIHFSDLKQGISKEQLLNFNIFDMLSSQPGWITGIIVGLFILGILFYILCAWFNFIFIDFVERKVCKIKESFGKISKKAFSYLIFSLSLDILFFGMIAIVTYPLTRNIGEGIKEMFGLLKDPISYLYIGSAIVIFFIFLLIRWVMFNLVIPDMYYSNSGFLKSLRSMIKVFFNNLKEIVIYIFMKIVLILSAGLIFILLFAGLFSFVWIFSMIGGLFVTLIYSMFESLKIFLIILGVIILLVSVIISLLCFLIVMVMIRVFFVYYRVEFYKKINKKDKKTVDYKNKDNKKRKNKVKR